MNLIFVDCEAYGDCPALGQLTEFGAVAYPSMKTFHGLIIKAEFPLAGPPIPIPLEEYDFDRAVRVFKEFDVWLPASPTMISDNPAFDWQWINDGFLRYLGRNPFGFSARRIGDYYAGLMQDFHAASKWKKYRQTKHDHHPVHDALGNAEAFHKFHTELSR